mmetsp:Transcript_8712/g.16486  ORF Transcript_8712/g.16486 Transcript_8712/m.16486 type:complete len:203 (-) Transcript_8712:247-855(-)
MTGMQLDDQEEVIPPQHAAFVPPPVDYRHVVLTVNRKESERRRNKKRGRDEDEHGEAMDAEADRGAELVLGKDGTVALQLGKRRSYATQDNFGKASGRAWKAPSVRASAMVVMNDKQKAKAAWDIKMAQKAKDKASRDHIKSIKKVALDKVKAEKLRRAEIKKKKEENRKKATVTQKITNSKTLKKMSKKAQKGVRFVKEVV